MEEMKSAKEWIGRKVKSKVILRNGYLEMPVGTIFTVEEKYGGLKLRSEPCEHCGARMFVTKVPINDMELLPIAELASKEIQEQEASFKHDKDCFCAMCTSPSKTG